MLASDHRHWRFFALQSNLPSTPTFAHPSPFPAHQRGLHSSDPYQAPPHYLGERCGLLTSFLPRGDHHYNQLVPETEVAGEPFNVPSPGLRNWERREGASQVCPPPPCCPESARLQLQQLWSFSQGDLDQHLSSLVFISLWVETWEWASYPGKLQGSLSPLPTPATPPAQV